MGQKRGHLDFLKQLSQKLTDFNNFWYTEFRRNVTSDAYKFIHRTCKMQPLYLVKSRQCSSYRNQYQIKRVNNTTTYVSLEISGSHSLSLSSQLFKQMFDMAPFCCTTHSRRRRKQAIVIAWQQLQAFVDKSINEGRPSAIFLHPPTGHDECSVVFITVQNLVGINPVIMAAIVFLPRSFFYLSSLSRRRLDVYHTSTHGVALVQFRMQV